MSVPATRLAETPRRAPPPARAVPPAYAPSRPRVPTDLQLAGNEGAAPTAELLEAFAALTPEALRRYPDARPLEAELAARWGLSSEQVLVTAGADEALDRVCRTWLSPERALLAPTPTFEMLLRYAGLAGAPLRAVPERDGRYPIEAVLDASPEGVGVVAVVSPNNPTGSVARTADLERLSAAFPEALLLVDAAYGEYADEDLAEAALAQPNALLVRTFSKAWGLAGARVGWVAGGREPIAALRAAAGPYPVASPSLALAGARLEQRDDMARGVARVRSERERIARELSELGWSPRPSQANFVYLPTPRARRLRDALAGFGIAVRAFDAPEAAVRIGCPSEESGLQRLRHALATIARPQALLLDVDGVLVDVSRSYRAAIVETASSYGVALSAGDVAAAKRGRHANDDWELTRRLLAERGVERSLAEVRARFERLYQGVDGQPGLRERESALVDPDTLRELAGGLPIALVTGRPRADAEHFVAWSGLGPRIETVVAREDAPRLKPDPAPVREAMSRLGVTRAWMVGDTPDDVLAARAAGVLPLGVIAPGHDRVATSEALLGAGAAEVAAGLAGLRMLREPLT